MKKPEPAPLAPRHPAAVPPLDGVRMITAQTGMKYAGRDDLLVMMFDQPAAAAGVFTQSKCSSAPVDWCRETLASGGLAKAVVVNAGNANAFTGQQGAIAVRETAQAAANLCNCEPSNVYLASTGVIGEPLEYDLLVTAIGHMADRNTPSDNEWQAAAEAIMTTDTYPKLAGVTCELDGKTVTVNGIAKGSGMIAPDMATMLSFVVTDLAVSPSLLQSILSDLVRPSFNAITVDSDTSTSDTLMMFACGTNDAAPLVQDDDPRLDLFRAAVAELLHNLALLIVRDGEGATKQIEVVVKGAENDAAAMRIARSIANSPLVKTAVAGEDANWGRVVMAVGKAGERANRDRLSIWFGDLRVAMQGARDPDYSEEEAAAIMKKDEITITVDVGINSGTAKMWTCDFTEQYIAINADYRS